MIVIITVILKKIKSIHTCRINSSYNNISYFMNCNFISLQGYSKNARNSVRIADLSSIDKQLEIYYLKTWSLPIPDDYITLYASWNIIWYQWFAGKRVLDLIWVFNWWKDPLWWRILYLYDRY